MAYHYNMELSTSEVEAVLFVRLKELSLRAVRNKVSPSFSDITVVTTKRWTK